VQAERGRCVELDSGVSQHGGAQGQKGKIIDRRCSHPRDTMYPDLKTVQLVQCFLGCWTLRISGGGGYATPRGMPRVSASMQIALMRSSSRRSHTSGCGCSGVLYLIASPHRGKYREPVVGDAEWLSRDSSVKSRTGSGSGPAGKSVYGSTGRE